MTRLKLISALALASSFFCGNILAATDLVVVTNLNSGVDKLSREEVAAIYMGQTKKLASGATVLPIDLSANSGKAKFYTEIVNKDLREINAYWAPKIYSGKGTPPKQVDNVAEVLEIVSSNKGAIGYVPRANADKRVKAVLDLSVAP